MNNSQTPSPPLFDGSVDLKSQMLALRSAQQQPQPMSLSPPPQVASAGPTQPQQQQQPASAVGGMESSILSRMIAAQSTTHAATTNMPIRIASMQDFRRSRNSLNTVHEVTSRGGVGVAGGRRMQQQNQAFNLKRTAGLGVGGYQPTSNSNRPTSSMSSGNPLLKMMEERMAAKASASASSSTNINEQQQQQLQQQMHTMGRISSPAMSSEESKAALHASISKWGGLANAATTAQQPTCKQQQQQQPVLIPPHEGGGLSSPRPGPVSQSSSSRTPLSPQQVDLLRQFTSSSSSQQSLRKDNVQQISQNELLQRVLLQQQQQQQQAASQNATFNNVQQQQQLVNNNINGMATMNPSISQQPGLTRCAVSLAEVDRLRRENQNIQLRQQRIMQERMNEQSLYLHHCNIAASALANRPSHEELNKLQAAQQLSMNKSNKKLSSSSDLKSKGSSFRKRRSLLEPDTDDESDCFGATGCSQTSLSTDSHAPSLTSTASSNKIHRSLSHCSARAALSGSMENLFIRSSTTNFLNNSISNTRNQSFGSGLMNNNGMNMKNQSFGSGLNGIGMNMKNQSFSSGINLTQQRQQQSTRQSQATNLRRSSSSNNYIKSLLCEQKSAGKAAATFETVLQKNNMSNNDSKVSNSSSDNIDTHDIVSSNNQQQEEELVSNKPIQVQAEEYVAPPIERTTSNGMRDETVIISAVPDRIKYQDVKSDDVTKPIDIVKRALLAAGSNCETKPSIDMKEDYFVKVTEMYDQEVVNAIRSNDVDALKRLHSNGTNLQCGNRFGETLIHLACRRSHRDLISFLINEAGVSLHVRDDFGRTPMHDCCWRAEPDLELFDMLLDKAPELLMLSDKRGHTPLDYSRREHWDILVPFLQERSAKLRSV